MKKIVSLFLLLLLALSLYSGQITFAAAKEALILWFEKLVPSMFVSMVLVRILYAKQILHHLHIPFLARILAIDEANMPLVLCSMLLGFPSGATFIDEAYGRGELDEAGARRLINTCSFATPGFVIMSCGLVFFHSMTIGFYLFAAQVMSGFILLLCTRQTAVIAMSAPKRQGPSNVLADAIVQSGKALYMIGGYLMLFMSVSSVLMPFVPELLRLPLRISAEFSSGVVYISQLPMLVEAKMLLTSFLLSFAGFCVHMQVCSMVEHCSLSYGSFLKYRILQGLCSVLIFFIFLTVFL